MFTVKLVQPDGHEQIFEAPHVWSNFHFDTGRRSVYASKGEGVEPLLFGSFGWVYVMNESGRTVAAYDLGEPPMPTAASQTASEAAASQKAA